MRATISRKPIALILVLMMALSLLPAITLFSEPAYAAGDENLKDIGKYAELTTATAFNNLTDGWRTLTLTSAPTGYPNAPSKVKHYWGYYVADSNSTQQRINIYVPDTATAYSPIMFNTNNSGWGSNAFPTTTIGAAASLSFSLATPANSQAGFMQEALLRGWVVVSYGARSKGDAAVAGEYRGHSPATITDTKAALRFLRYNYGVGALTVGDPDRIIVTGSSGGGALTADIASSGNHPDYYPSLYEIGAAGVQYDAGINNAPGQYVSTIGDDVFATISYCPMVDFGFADMAYEWDYGAYRAKLASGGYGAVNPRSSTAYDAWQISLSKALAADFEDYLDTYGNSGLTVANIKDAVGMLMGKSLERYLAAGNTVAQLAARLRQGNNNATSYAALPMDWYTVNADGSVTFNDYEKYVEYEFFTSQWLKAPPISSSKGLFSTNFVENDLWGGINSPYGFAHAATWAMDFNNWGNATTGWAKDIVDWASYNSAWNTYNGLPGTGTAAAAWNAWLVAQRAAMYETSGNLKPAAKAAYDAGTIGGIKYSDYIAQQVKMASPMAYLLNPVDAAKSDTAPYWYVRHGTVDDGTAWAAQGMLAYGIANNSKIKSYDNQFILGQAHGGHYDRAEAFAWLDGVLGAEAKTDYSALRFNPNRTPDATLTTSGVTYNVYRETYCLDPISGLDAGIFVANIRVPVSLNGVPFDANVIKNNPILYTNPWGGDSGQPAPAATAAANGMTLTALQKGFVTVNVGMRGMNNSVAGYNYGKIPNPIVDLKASLRYLHYNKGYIPGDTEKIIVVGTSSGGSATVQLGTSGNTMLYDSELADIGAYMGKGARDDIWMAGPSCPVMNRGNADPLIAWALFGDLADATGAQASPLNKAMSIEGMRYFTTLGLKAEYAVPSAGIKVGDALTTVNYGAYTLEGVKESLMYYLNVQMTNAGSKSAIENYLAGTKNSVRRNTWITPVFNANDKLIDIRVTSWADFWRYNSNITGNATINGNGASGALPDPLQKWWYQFDASGYNNVVLLPNGVLPNNTPTSTGSGAENLSANPTERSFGKPTDYGAVFSGFGVEWAKNNKGVTFSQEYLDLLEYQRNALDPVYFLLEKEAGRMDVDVAPNWNIRAGSADFVVPPFSLFAFATKLANMGNDVDALLTWDQGHGTTNDTAGFFRYIDEVLKKEAASVTVAGTITYTESGYNDEVKYNETQKAYAPGGSIYRKMNIKVPTSIRTVAYDASESPILFINGSENFASTAVPDIGGFAFSPAFARKALWEGWIVVEAGNRAGAAGLADLKQAIACLRSDGTIPGNKDLIFALGGDYALLLGATAADPGEAVFAAATYNPSQSQAKSQVSNSNILNGYVIPSALRQLQKVFAMGYDGKVASAAVDAYLADEGLASSFAVTYNNADKTMASNVLSVNITGWPGAAAADLSIAGLDYMAGYDDEYIAPNWWIRSDAEAAKGNPTFLDLADQLKGDAETVNCKLVWDGSPDVNGFFDFAHYVLAYTEENKMDAYVGLKNTPNGDNNSAIPGTSNPTQYYDHYDILTEEVDYTVKADIPYVAYESVPLTYKAAKAGLQTAGATGYYQRLDIYRKKGTENETQPVLVYVHGGAGSAGDKRGPTHIDNPSRDQMTGNSGIYFGYTVIELNYRLNVGTGAAIPGRNYTTKFPYPATGAEDVRAAIRWIKENADMLGIDPERIILSGASAGGEVINRAAIHGSNPARFYDINNSFKLLGAAEVNDNLCAVLDVFGTGVTSGGNLLGQNLMHGYAPPYYIVNGERDSIANWRTNSLALYKALVDAGNEIVRYDVIEGAAHELAPQHFSDVFNVGTMYKWLYDLGIMGVPAVTIQGPENIAFSYPAFAENEVSVDVLGDLEAESTGFEIYSATVANPVPRFTAKIAGEITGADNVFAGDAFDEFEAVLNADGTPVSRFSYATITNMDEILAAAGINVNRANQTFTVRQTNPALNFAYGAGTFLNNQQTKTYKLADLSEIAEFRILLMNGSSTVTLEVFEGGNASGNARFSIVISSNIAVYSPITSIKISDENGAAAPAMMSAPRNSILQLGVNLNDGATGSGLLWTVSDTSFAVVDASGKVTILNKMGTVVLTAKDPGSGITHAIVLRIT